jgi:hypothetical protein
MLMPGGSGPTGADDRRQGAMFDEPIHRPLAPAAVKSPIKRTDPSRIGQ